MTLQPLEEFPGGYLVSDLQSPGPKERFATAMLHDGVSLAYYDAKQFAKSIAPLEAALAILVELEHPQAAGIAYNLACSLALTGRKEQALEALALCLGTNPRYRPWAAQDSDFDSIGETPVFEELLGQPNDEARMRQQ